MEREQIETAALVKFKIKTAELLHTIRKYHHFLGHCPKVLTISVIIYDVFIGVVSYRSRLFHHKWALQDVIIVLYLHDKHIIITAEHYV